ncbi:cmgc mapk protein kinase [Phytophthora cinnamomi]|uniref:cmgc mapk protein kinase n=1 Tax=Phytophthora cinnamomi TaxID=4785 RepID=UPI003559E419|nr:cmgc mapk protein kinase [Phytophthora cinnamomi]
MEAAAAAPGDAAARPSKTPAAPEDAPEIVGEPVTLEELVAPTAAGKSKEKEKESAHTPAETAHAPENNEQEQQQQEEEETEETEAQAETQAAAVAASEDSEPLVAVVETEAEADSVEETTATPVEGLTDGANETAGSNDSETAVLMELAAFDDDEEDDDEFHEAMEDGVDLLGDCGLQDKPSVPPTMSFSVNEMEVITNRGGRAGSLSKFLDDADTFRRRSLPSYPDDQLFAGSLSQKKMTLTAFLDMQIDPVLEILEDTDSDIRLWLMQPETVKEVLAEFVTPPVLSGEPHEEYGYYKKHFLCSEIIMKLYTGEEDLYESFSSDSSSGSTASTAVFGCQEPEDIEKWEQLYSIFKNPIPLDEMQLLFFSKALVRLHDGFCLEEGYVNNVLKRFLPMVVPHLYSNTIKYMLTLILQSYESVHPITGRNDAMEIAAPLLAEATRVYPTKPENLPLVENTTNLLVDMLQANQADRLGAFSRREGGVYLSKYFVRDQFGTIRGFESMTHGYHNFLQYMLLEEMSKQPTIVEELFKNAADELDIIREKKLTEVSSALNIHVVAELLVLCQKLLNESVESDDDNNQTPEMETQNTQMFGYSSFASEQYPNSPHEGANETSMYNLTSLPRGHALWTFVLDVARKSCGSFVAQLNKGLPSSVEISLAKYLNNLVLLNDATVDEELHKSGLIQAYLSILEKRSSFDMLIIHIVPAISFILRDADASRAKNCPLTKDLFGVDIKVPENIVSLLLRAKLDIPTLDIYAAILHDVIDEVFTSKALSQNNAQVVFHCKRSPSWAKLSEKTRFSSGSEKSDSARGSDERRSSVGEQPAVSERGSTAEEAAAETESTPTSEPLLKEEPVPASSEEPETASELLSTGRSSSVKEKDALTPSSSPSLPASKLEAADDEPETSEKDEDAKKEEAKPPAIVTDASNTKTVSPKNSAEESPKETPDTTRNSEGDGSRKSHYFKNVLQSPVFKSPMRLGSVIKPPVAPPAQDSGSQANGENQQRNSFGWNSVFKRLRKSLVTTHNEKADKKVLALSNEAYASPNVAPRQTDVFVVDTSRGEDITTFVKRDAGVVVTDVPAASSKSAESATNVITSGYMYKNKYPETGHRNVWERYYFVLNRSDGSLSYYISEAHAKDRTFVRGTSRPLTVSEGLPMHVQGQNSVFGFQINTQGHGSFMVLVDSIDTRLTWLTEILVCVSNANSSPPLPKQRLSLLPDDAPKQRLSATSSSVCSLKCNKEEMKELVMEFYRNLFGPNLKFSSPLDAPASFWMEEKIDPVSDGCVLSSNLPDCVPYWGEFHGYKRLCDYWKIRDETVERSSGRVLRILVDEDEETAVVMTSTTFRILRNSEIVTEESCDIVSVSGGSIVSIHCTFDSHRIAQAFKKEGISAS